MLKLNAQPVQGKSQLECARKDCHQAARSGNRQTANSMHRQSVVGPERNCFNFNFN